MFKIIFCPIGGFPAGSIDLGEFDRAGSLSDSSVAFALGRDLLVGVSNGSHERPEFRIGLEINEPTPEGFR
jgi:hypothetical protein